MLEALAKSGLDQRARSFTRGFHVGRIAMKLGAFTALAELDLQPNDRAKLHTF
jgi:hypothetical protein